MISALVAGWWAHAGWTRRARPPVVPGPADATGAQYRAIHDHARDGIVCFDGTGRVHSVNAAAVALFALPADQLVGSQVSSLLAGFSPAGPAANMAWSPGDAHATRALGAAGRSIPVSVSVAGWTGSDGQPAYAAIVRDATDQVTAQAELADAAQNTLIQAELFAGVTAVMAQGLVAWDRAGRMLLANQPYRTLLDLPEALVRPGVHFTEVEEHLAERGEFGPGDAKALARAHFAAAASGTASHFAVQRPNGTWLDVEHRPLAYNGFVTTFTDITQARQMQAALEESELRFRLLAEHSGDVVMLADLKGVPRYVSPASLRVLGWPPEALMGRSALDFMHPDDIEGARAVLHAIAAPGSELLASHRFRRPDDSWLWLDVRSRRFDHPSLGEPCCIAVLRDATERKRVEEALGAACANLAEAAETDTLTGLPNRRHFATALDREWGRAAREGLPVSVAMIDVDQFKRFNDQHGHAAGDECLRRVAATALGSARRVTDTVARWGGEEFILLMPNTDAAGCLVVVETLRRSVQALGIAHPGNTEYGVVTCSIGTATTWPSNEDTAAAQRGWIAAADAALYAAKHAGRNRVVQHAPPAEPETDNEARAEAMTSQAVQA